MTASTLKPQLRHAVLSKLNSKRSSKQNALQKGFTLVELMIVIVIVGILSAIALPSFMSQSDKAKLTEAKQQSSAYLKQYYALYQENATPSAAEIAAICPQTVKYFSYNCSGGSTIIATGQAAAGSGLSAKTITSTVTLPTGEITIGGVSG